jgi:serine/threonine-protein kinase
MSDIPETPKRTVFMRPEDRGVPPGASTPPSGTPIDTRSAAPPPSNVTQRFGQAGSLVGTTLNDNYEVTRYITQGGMGEIYEGRQIRGNVKVAIKVILPQFAADPEFYTLLEREADLLASLGHDAIVKFRGLSHDPRSQVDYLTLEYVHGPSLEEQMDTGPIDPDSCRALLRRLAAGLDTAHDKGVYHRDLSPDNILLRDGRIERATIIDFGIAKDADTNKKTVIGAGFGGKLGFAAPEAFGLYGREIGAWTDIYSLALVVAAAARGKVIDMGTATPIDAIRARQTVPELEGVEPWLGAVLARMLQPDPADRVRSMSAVIAAVDALPAVGTPFDAAQVQFPAVAAGTKPRESTKPPGPAPFGRLDGGDNTDLKLVRTEPTSKTLVTDAPKSKLPLIIGGGVVVAVVAGALFAFSGKDSADTTAQAPAAVEDTAAAPAVVVATNWASARGVIAAIPCSDIRATVPAPGATTLPVTGWMAAGTQVPATAGGYKIDSTALRSISPAPNAETCAIIGRLKQAAGDAGTQGTLKMPALAEWKFDQLKQSGGYSQVPFGIGALTKQTYLVNIDDGQADASKRVSAAPLPAGMAALPYAGRQPVRYLQFWLSPLVPPPNFAETGSGAAVSTACAQGCESTSGWVVLK